MSVTRTRVSLTRYVLINGWRWLVTHPQSTRSTNANGLVQLLPIFDNLLILSFFYDGFTASFHPNRLVISLIIIIIPIIIIIVIIINIVIHVIIRMIVAGN